jgi:hypothetical protein
MFMWRSTLAVTLPALLAACSTIGQITVKDYEAKSGERVMAGQAGPRMDPAAEWPGMGRGIPDPKR